MRFCILFLCFIFFIGCEKSQIREDAGKKKLEILIDSTVAWGRPAPGWLNQRLNFKKTNQIPQFCFVFITESLDLKLLQENLTVNAPSETAAYYFIMNQTLADLQIIFNHYNIFTEADKKEIQEIVKRIDSTYSQLQKLEQDEKLIEEVWWTKKNHMDYRETPPKEKTFYWHCLYQCRNYSFWQKTRNHFILEQSKNLDPKKIQVLLQGFKKIDGLRFPEK